MFDLIGDLLSSVFGELLGALYEEKRWFRWFVNLLILGARAALVYWLYRLAHPAAAG